MIERERGEGGSKREGEAERERGERVNEME